MDEAVKAKRARDAMEKQRQEQLAAARAERERKARIRAGRTSVTDEELAAADEVVEKLPPGRLRDALTKLRKNGAVDLNMSNLGLDLLLLEVTCVYLKANKLVERLTLTDNHIGPDGCHFIADALKCNNKLKDLVLLGNDIGDDGAATLASAIEVNTTLLRLDLSRNFIRRDGAKALARAFLTNETLRELVLVGNWIQTEGRRALYKVLGAETMLPPLMRYTKVHTRSTLRQVKLA